MENDLTLSDMISKKIKFEFPQDKNQKIPQIGKDEIPKEIYLAKKTVEKLNTKNDKWNPNELDSFFQGLEIFGTDFSMISCTLLPTKTRNQIKKKFSLEDKKGNPRIKMSFMKKTEKNGCISKELEDLNELVNGETQMKIFPDFNIHTLPFHGNEMIQKKLQEIVNEQKMEFEKKQQMEKFLNIVF